MMNTTSSRRLLLCLTVLALCFSSDAFHLALPQPTAIHSTHISSPFSFTRCVSSCPSQKRPNSHYRATSSQLCGQSQDEEEEASEGNALVGTIGLICQPIVWISLYNVATTGAGLPAGPFGLVGAVEGLSYLVVVGFAAASVVRVPSLKLVESLSWLTLVAGVFTLCVLVAQQGCVPNAKPILDYSAYLPVCNTEQTPGLFGG